MASLMGAGANLRFFFLSGIVEQAITQFARDFRARVRGIFDSAIPERKDGLLVVQFYIFFSIKPLRSITTVLLNGIIPFKTRRVVMRGEESSRRVVARHCRLISLFAVAPIY